MTVKKIGLMGSQWSVILCMAVNVYYLVIMMRYFEDVPVSLPARAGEDRRGRSSESPVFGGAATFAKPGIATLTMFYGVTRWNEVFPFRNLHLIH